MTDFSGVLGELGHRVRPPDRDGPQARGT